MNNKTTTKNKAYSVMLAFCTLLFTIGIGFMIIEGDAANTLNGIRNIVLHPSLGDFDAFFWAESLSAPFIQSALCALFTLGIFKITSSELKGPHIAALLMVAGFAFYGKNILSMWFPVAGVFIHAKVNKIKMSDASALAAFSTCLGPIFGALAFYTEPLVPLSILAFAIAAVFGVISGYLLAIFAAYTPLLHKKLLLFNAGLAGGIGAVLIFSFMKAIGLGHERYPYKELGAYITSKNMPLSIACILVFGFLVAAGIYMGGWSKFKQLVWFKDKGDDHVVSHGLPATLILMGVGGLLGTAYSLAVGAEMNGTTFCGIFSIAAFMANGATIRTQLPALLGVFATVFVVGGIMAADGLTFFEAAMANVTSNGFMMTALFTVGVAPVAGNFGALAGFFVGMCQALLVPNINPLHGQMLLYNNGLSYGLVIVFTYPIFSKFSKKTIKE